MKERLRTRSQSMCRYVILRWMAGFPALARSSSSRKGGSDSLNSPCSCHTQTQLWCVCATVLLASFWIEGVWVLCTTVMSADHNNADLPKMPNRRRLIPAHTTRGLPAQGSKPARRRWRNTNKAHLDESRVARHRRQLALQIKVSLTKRSPRLRQALHMSPKHQA